MRIKMTLQQWEDKIIALGLGEILDRIIPNCTTMQEQMILDTFLMWMFMDPEILKHTKKLRRKAIKHGIMHRRGGILNNKKMLAFFIKEVGPINDRVFKRRIKQDEFTKVFIIGKYLESFTNDKELTKKLNTH